MEKYGQKQKKMMEQHSILPLDDTRHKGSVLLVEDNEDDVLLTRRAWKKLHVQNRLEIIRNGKEALDRLLFSAKGEELPSLVLIDLRLPVLTGKQVLKELKEAKFYLAPVVVLTTSRESRDISECYELNAKSYVRKPVSSKEFLYVFRETLNYWLNVNECIVK